MLESTFQNKITKRLDALIAQRKPLYYFVKEAKSIRGLPDLVLCVSGMFVTWEVKRDAKEAQKNSGRIVLQRYVGSRIQNAQGIFHIVHPDNVDECFQEIEKILDLKSLSVKSEADIL